MSHDLLNSQVCERNLIEMHMKGLEKETGLGLRPSMYCTFTPKWVQCCMDSIVCTVVILYIQITYSYCMYPYNTYSYMLPLIRTVRSRVASKWFDAYAPYKSTTLVTNTPLGKTGATVQMMNVVRLHTHARITFTRGPSHSLSTLAGRAARRVRVRKHVELNNTESGVYCANHMYWSSDR